MVVARAWTRSLKLRVRAMGGAPVSVWRGASAFVVRPHDLGGGDVFLLARLGAAGQQDHQGFAISAEIDAVSWAPVYAVLVYPLPYRFGVGEVALFEARQCDGDFGGGLVVQAGEPGFERALAGGG